jgi:hypothetical protein
VKARNGTVVEAVVIQGQDREDAERKLFQMYVGCTVLDCAESTVHPGREEPLDVGGIISLISRQE